MRQCMAGLALVASILCSTGFSTRVATGVAMGQDSRNAATWYRRAIDRLDKLDERDFELIERYRKDPALGPSIELRAVLSRSGPMLELFRRGARQPYSDFDLDWSQGFDLVLPHIGQLLAIARVAQADAMVHLHDGDGAGAAMRVASIYSVADHFGSDRIMIGTLVGQRVFRVAEEATRMGFDRAVFDPASAEVLLRAVRRLDTDDPFSMVEAVAGEQDVAVSWLGDRFGDQETRGDIVGLMQVDSPEMTEAFGEMSDEAFAGELEAYDLMMDGIVAAFENPDPEAGRAALEQIEKELLAGEHGLVAQIVTPAFSHVHERMQMAREQVEQRRAMLEAIVQGLALPQAQANAAWYYAQAIAKLREDPPFPVDELFAVALDERRPISSELVARLDQATVVVDLLREGSMLAKCDFSTLRPAWVPSLCPDDLAGIRDVLCLLQVDARRLLSAAPADGAIEAAVDRLATSYRIIAHLGVDDSMLAPLVAHDAFRRTRVIVEAAIDGEAFDDAHRATLFAAADRIARKDPFGYIGSVVAGRQMLEKLAGKYVGQDGPGEAGPSRARARELRDRARMADGEQILHVLALYDTMIRASEQAGAGTNATSRRDPLSRMDGIISRPALDAVRSSVPRFAPLIARGEIDVFHGREIPQIGRFVPRHRKARGDLRDGLRRLRPSPRASATTRSAASSRDPDPSPAPPTPGPTPDAPGSASPTRPCARARRDRCCPRGTSCTQTPPAPARRARSARDRPRRDSSRRSCSHDGLPGTASLPSTGGGRSRRARRTC